MTKFKILMPCYNDWPSVFKLLENIDNEISDLNSEFSAVIINDGSSEKTPNLKPSYKNLKTVEIVNIKINQGHTKSNATGIRYLSKRGGFDYLILMDGDGEDRPEEIKMLVEKALTKKNISVVARRVRRSEGIIFEIFYNLHKLITLIFTGKNMNFGHYSCLTKKDVDLVSEKKSLWVNYSGTIKKFVSKLDSVPCVRGKRYVQPSKMSFFRLVIHSFSILGVFKYAVLFRSVLFFSIIFFLSPNLYGGFIGFILAIFTLCIFLVSGEKSIEKLSNYDEHITNVQKIHTNEL